MVVVSVVGGVNVGGIGVQRGGLGSSVLVVLGIVACPLSYGRVTSEFFVRFSLFEEVFSRVPSFGGLRGFVNH